MNSPSDPILEMKAEQRRREAAANRSKAPHLAALLDEIRAKHPTARLVWGTDLVTGHTLGKREDNDNAFTVPADYFPSRPVEQKKGKAK